MEMGNVHRGASLTGEYNLIYALTRSPFFRLEQPQSTFLKMEKVFFFPQKIINM